MITLILLLASFVLSAPTSVSVDTLPAVDPSQNCLLTGQPSQKPNPSLSFCFRSNINACCLTGHDQMIESAYGVYMPSMCLSSFPEFEFYACLGCHFSQPNSTTITTAQSTKGPTVTTKIIKLCTNFVQRLWGQDDINSPTTIFDNCGLIPDGSTVRIPSQTWSSAKAFFETFKPPLMTDYAI